MNKNFLYYTILTFAFIFLFAIDVIILASLNLTSGFFMAFGAAIVLSLFSAFKFFLKEHPYFREKESCGHDNGENQASDSNKSQVEDQEKSPVNLDNDIDEPKVNKNDFSKEEHIAKNEPERYQVTSFKDRLFSWNAKYYFSINIVILIALIAFLYILPVSSSWNHGRTISLSDDYKLQFFYYAVFCFAAIGLVMNWGHSIVKNRKAWLYLFNIAVQVFISMMYVMVYLGNRSLYWGYLFWPIACSLYICIVSNRLLKDNNQ